MPLYDYVCRSCKKKFEELRRFSDTGPVTCPKCGSTECEKKPATFITTDNLGLSKTPKGKSPWLYT
ncbi:putative regulatory protein, FmdB family [Dehalogenimonas formicexedens]|uniref:Putative regulatory protein, FmdB family n=1 Tax=Dehalogenimonas formicexedens TaxID=1839801 RepID=A0A1P8F6J5_9CHLR|nr:putative regulatory protein, FmdB family [Dehalogenimonas formicexedens]